jgi:hypothetical protein
VSRIGLRPASVPFSCRTRSVLIRPEVGAVNAEAEIPDSLLTDLWEYYRFSCPKRNTIGAYMLGTLEPDWHKYVEFHLKVLGCRFCQANLDDLQSQSQETQQEAFQARIMESTIGFLSRPM